MRLAVKVIPRPLWFTSRKTIRVTMELEVPKRPIFKLTLSTAVVQQVCSGRRKKRFCHYKCHGSMAKKCQFLIFSFLSNDVFHIYKEWRGEEEEKVKHEEKSQNYPLWTYIKTSTHPLFGASSLLLVHIWFTPRLGTQRLWGFISLEIRPWKCDHEKKKEKKTL